MRFLFLLLPFIIQCSSAPKAKTGEAIRIELNGKPGTVTETRYFSNASVKSFAERQIHRDKEESVEFTTQTKIKAYDPAEKTIIYSVKTVAKDGTVELNDLAFPEKGEEIEYVTRTNGTVLKAGKYPPHSLFFVPSLPVPDEAVYVGDTWTMAHTWYSAAEAIPLRLEIVGILKAMVPCAGKTCADIEISGGVKLVNPPTAQSARFASRVWGRVLYSPDRGDILWSEMRSQEEMIAGSDEFRVLSCMVSETKIKDYKLKLGCVPGETPVTQVPVNL